MSPREIIPFYNWESYETLDYKMQRYGLWKQVVRIVTTGL
jgi:hypothetical protein